MPLPPRLGTWLLLALWLGLVLYVALDLALSGHLLSLLVTLAASSLVTFPLLDHLGSPLAREDAQP